jgi:hypothetical protein
MKAIGSGMYAVGHDELRLFLLGPNISLESRTLAFALSSFKDIAISYLEPEARFPKFHIVLVSTVRARSCVIGFSKAVETQTKALVRAHLVRGDAARCCDDVL